MEKTEEFLEISNSIPNTPSGYLKIEALDFYDLFRKLPLHCYFTYGGPYRLNSEGILVSGMETAFSTDDKVIWFKSEKSPPETCLITVEDFEYFGTWICKEWKFGDDLPHQRFLYRLKLEIA